jgi:hypothetical protein
MGCDEQTVAEKWQSDPGFCCFGRRLVNGLALARSIIYNLSIAPR